MPPLALIVGARPHFIKAAALLRAFGAAPALEPVLIHTGQHYDARLSDAFFRELGLPRPRWNLGVGSGPGAWQVGRMVVKLDEVLRELQPAAVLVFGDTNSTAAGAIAAAKNHLLLGHVEAGLREWDKRIPEEVNKLLTDAVSDLYFCPTPTAVTNLHRCGIREGVFLTGDVGLDLLAAHPEKSADTSLLHRLGLKPKAFFLLTCHRAANTDRPEPLLAILRAAIQLEHPVVFPIHPRTRAAIQRFGLGELLRPPLHPLEPLGFWETQCLVRHARTVLTDSGGLIKEAYFHQTPAVILDRQTEWVETVREGWSHIVGPDTEAILEAVRTAQPPEEHRQSLGDGRAGER
ncbi:MAG: UDP-N-acetylglucosamine 2-epimerase (non-hydrolyzing), partial [Bacteroidetes bacterium]